MPEIEPIIFPRPIRGLATGNTTAAIPHEWAVKLEDMTIDEWGGVKSRRGIDHIYQQVNDEVPQDVFAGSLDGKEFLYIINYNKGTASTGILAVHSSGISGFAGFDQSTPYDVGYATYDNAAYFSRGSIGVGAVGSFKITLSGATPAYTAITGTIFDGTSSRFPRAQHLAVHNDQMFAANVWTGSVPLTTRLYWSNIADVETWDAADYIDFDDGGGGAITGLYVYGEDLVVFTESSIGLLSGRSEASFVRYTLDRTIGTPAHRTIGVLRGALVFFDPAHGVWSFDGSGFSNLSGTLSEYIIDGMNWTYRGRASAAVHHGKYYLSVPWGTDIYNSKTFVYDSNTGAWTSFGYGVVAAVEKRFDDFWSNEGLALMGVGYTFTGGTPELDRYVQLVSPVKEGYDALAGNESVGGTYLSPWYEVAAIGDEVRVHRLVFKFGNPGGLVGGRILDHTLNVYADYDRTTPIFTQDITPSGATIGGTDGGIVEVTGLSGARHSSLCFEFVGDYGTNGTSNFHLLDIEAFVSSQRQSRGA